uniref:Uncharacterized protein n=1 Tax=Rhizophagus irregularis (strain DAOM 181602 / DAOM 197198 / MUCL 43194) TaxID=747089 RepID=U9UI27_RHIID
MDRICYLLYVPIDLSHVVITQYIRKSSSHPWLTHVLTLTTNSDNASNSFRRFTISHYRCLNEEFLVKPIFLSDICTNMFQKFEINLVTPGFRNSRSCNPFLGQLKFIGNYQG